MPTMAKKKPPTVPVYIRLPVSLKDAVEKRADAEKRSFSKEVEIALEKHLAEIGLWPPDDAEGDDAGEGEG